MADPQPSFPSRDLQNLMLPHRVEVDVRTGAASLSVPVPVTPGRAGFQPALALTYSSAAPNSVYGLGWSLSGVPSLALSLKDGLPKYDGRDRYAFGGEELVPRAGREDRSLRVIDQGEHWAHLYRSKVERDFTRFEKWVHKTTRRTHWCTRDRNNTVSIFGLDPAGRTRITDPGDENRTFQWLLEWQYDRHGNAIHYEYAPEDAVGVAATASFERNRLFHSSGYPQRYLRRISYGNTVPLRPGDPDPGQGVWLISILLDYGERDGERVPSFQTSSPWPARSDPFSTYRAGFEIRTYRLCRRLLMFHHFAAELGEEATLVGELALEHRADVAGTTLRALRYTGHRSERRPEGYMHTRKALPPLVFRYTEPEVERAFVAASRHENVPYGIGGLNHQWVDLYGEGLPGVLFENHLAWYYKPNLGGGRLGPQQQVLEKPSLQPGSYAFSDFDGDGNLNLVVLQGREAGFYEYDRDLSRWSGFRPFAAAAHVKALDTATQLLDLNGDGRADIVTIEPERLVWYPSKGKEGFDAPVELARPRSNGTSKAPTLGGDPRMNFFFADMTGDGLPDQVRVQNGRVEYWPQLGNGHFGEGVVMEGAPVLEFGAECDANRIRLVDLDGSGTSDLLYIGRGEIRYWINASGNRFVEGGTLASVPYIDNLASAQVLDFLGDGTPCLVWSTALPGHAQAPIQYLRLTGGVKPRLLLVAENSMGRTARVTYGHSAAHYLRDKQNGRGWNSRLPQHVTVVDRLTVLDQVGNTRFESLYEYHDGSFDGEERVFRGFGLVDQYDSDTYRGSPTVPESDHTGPACVRTWFHDGVAGREPRRAQDYYRGDPRAKALPGHRIESPDALSPAAFAAAHRALAGQVVRTELYGLDPDGRRQPHPYQVTQANYRVRRMQPERDDQDPCFAVFPGEALTSVYEQDPTDPRVSHTFTFDVDDFGNVTRSCTVAYSRRRTSRIGVAAQERTHAGVTRADFFNADEPNRYELGVPRESESFELAGLEPAADGETDTLFTLEEVDRRVNAALRTPLRFDERLTGGIQARRARWERVYYWNASRTDVLPWPQVGPLALVHHTEAACFTGTLLASVLGERLPPVAPREEGLYRHHDEHWWQASPTLHYLPAEGFNLLSREVQGTWREDRPVEAVTRYDYDAPYLLSVTGVTDPLGSRTLATGMDYHVVAPWRIVDPNENVSEVRYDPLGVVVVSTLYGRLLSSAGTEQPYGNEPLEAYRSQPDVSLDEILDAPGRFLQGAGTYFHYELDTWTAAHLPLRSVSLLREELVHDGEGGGARESRIQVAVGYVDGFGRSLQVKERVESGPAVAPDGRGGLVTVDVAPPHPRWRASGHTVYNNKQQVVRQYEPFFSTTHLFQSDGELESFGVTTVTEYDPLGRPIRVRYPNDTRTRAEHTPWGTTRYDPNDTVRGSRYEEFREGLDDENPEKEALRRAQDHAGTPTHVYVDPLGREVVLLEDGGTDGLRRTETTLDFAGDAVRVQDPRGLTAFEYRRDMLGRVLHERSMDAGEKWIFADALDRPLHFWDARGVHQRLHYDELGRVTRVRVDGALGLDHTTEHLIYGDDPEVTQAALRNLRGQLVQHLDQAGILRFHRYDPAGRPLHHDRQLLADYKHEPHWDTSDPPSMEDEPAFETRLRYDALGRVTLQQLPDGTARQIDYHPGGGVRQVRVSTPDGVLRDAAFLRDTAHNARGQRTRTDLGNDVAVAHEYDEQTFRLRRLSARHADGHLYQDLHYTYDPAGNLTWLVDRAQEPPAGDVLRGLRGEVHSTSTFRYDAFYQLREATGRAHEALQQHDHDARREGRPGWIKGTRHLGLNNGDVVRRYTRLYAYDAAGNMRRMSHRLHLPDGDTSRDWHTDFWVSPSSNRSLPALGPGGLPVSDPESRFDTNGNCLYLPHLRGFAWSYRNHLARAVLVDRSEEGRPDDAEYYVYGSDGQRVRKVLERVVHGDGLEVVEKIYLDGCEIKRIRSGGQPVLERWTSHVTDGSDRIALVHSWTLDRDRRETTDVSRRKIHYQLGNHLGSASLELGEHGELISYEEYFPHGCTAFIAGDNLRDVRLKDYRYSGKERDDATGLYYYGYRYYAPWVGRWLSPDPLGPEDGLNLYRFVANNPLTFMDELGLMAGMSGYRERLEDPTLPPHPPSEDSPSSPGSSEGARPDSAQGESRPAQGTGRPTRPQLTLPEPDGRGRIQWVPEDAPLSEEPLPSDVIQLPEEPPWDHRRICLPPWEDACAVTAEQNPTPSRVESCQEVEDRSSDAGMGPGGEAEDSEGPESTSPESSGPVRPPSIAQELRETIIGAGGDSDLGQFGMGIVAGAVTLVAEPTYWVLDLGTLVHASVTDPMNFDVESRQWASDMATYIAGEMTEGNREASDVSAELAGGMMIDFPTLGVRHIPGQIETILSDSATPGERGVAMFDLGMTLYGAGQGARSYTALAERARSAMGTQRLAPAVAVEAEAVVARGGAGDGGGPRVPSSGGGGGGGTSGPGSGPGTVIVTPEHLRSARHWYEERWHPQEILERVDSGQRISAPNLPPRLSQRAAVAYRRAVAAVEKAYVRVETASGIRIGYHLTRLEIFQNGVDLPSVVEWGGEVVGEVRVEVSRRQQRSASIRRASDAFEDNKFIEAVDLWLLRKWGF